MDPIDGHRVPKGFFRQFLYPFIPEQAKDSGPEAEAAQNKSDGVPR